MPQFLRRGLCAAFVTAALLPAAALAAWPDHPVKLVGRIRREAPPT